MEGEVEKGEKAASREKEEGRRSLVRGGWRDMVKLSCIAGGCTHGTRAGSD